MYLFAGITGDLIENHVDQQAMQGTEYGGRIAHGMPTLSFISTGSTRLIERVGGLAVSYIKTASGSSIPFAGTHAPLRAMRTSGHGRSR